jgi:hypothetical protein
VQSRELAESPPPHQNSPLTYTHLPSRATPSAPSPCYISPDAGFSQNRSLPGRPLGPPTHATSTPYRLAQAPAERLYWLAIDDFHRLRARRPPKKSRAKRTHCRTLSIPAIHTKYGTSGSDALHPQLPANPKRTHRPMPIRNHQSARRNKGRSLAIRVPPRALRRKSPRVLGPQTVLPAAEEGCLQYGVRPDCGGSSRIRPILVSRPEVRKSG